MDWVSLACAAKSLQAGQVNTASRNLAHHLGVLEAKLQHPTDYDQALNYFLEEFAGDADFVAQSHAEEAPRLEVVIRRVAAQALGRESPVALDHFKALRLAQLHFTHGNAVVAGRVAIFFYFEGANTGLAALIPGVRSAAEVARFRLPAGLGGHPMAN